MKNRAKCKLCGDIIESFHKYDHVSCKCGEISVDGGTDYLKCGAKNWDNFLRVDENGNEIIVKAVDEKDTKVNAEPKPLTRVEQIEMLKVMLKNIENLPPQAMSTPINHYDFYSYLILVLSILKTPPTD